MGEPARRKLEAQGRCAHAAAGRMVGRREAERHGEGRLGVDPAQGHGGAGGQGVGLDAKAQLGEGPGLVLARLGVLQHHLRGAAPDAEPRVADDQRVSGRRRLPVIGLGRLGVGRNTRLGARLDARLGHVRRRPIRAGRSVGVSSGSCCVCCCGCGCGCAREAATAWVTVSWASWPSLRSPARLRRNGPSFRATEWPWASTTRISM